VSKDSKRIFTNDFYQEIPLDEAGFTKFSKEFMDFVLNRYENKIKTDSSVYKINDQNIVDNLRRAKNFADAEKIYNSLFDYTTKYDHLTKFYNSKITKSDKRISYSKSLHDEMIYYLDKELSMIFNLVSNKKLVNNTIIIITSDHGEEFMEHGSIEHPADHLYNATTSVPLIMYVPGIKQRKIDNLVQSIDILPTVLGLTGLESPKNHFDGIDLTDSILGRKQTQSNNYLISEGPGIDSIRDKRWKLYVKNTQGENKIDELYDLYKDPLEKDNLAQKEPKIVKSLQDNLIKIIYKK